MPIPSIRLYLLFYSILDCHTGADTGFCSGGGQGGKEFAQGGDKTGAKRPKFFFSPLSEFCPPLNHSGGGHFCCPPPELLRRGTILRGGGQSPPEITQGGGDSPLFPPPCIRSCCHISKILLIILPKDSNI